VYSTLIITLFNAGNVLLCVIYQLKFTLFMYVTRISCFVYTVQYYPWFHVTAVGLGTYCPPIWGSACIYLSSEDIY